MEEKKTVKISLWTAICILIIILLIIALVGMYFYYNKDNNQLAKNIKEDSTILNQSEDKENSKNTNTNIDTEENNIITSKRQIFTSLSIDTANKKVVDNDIDTYYIKKTDDIGNLSIRNGEIYFTSKLDKEKWVEFGVVSNENDVKMRKNFEDKITGFTKKIVDAQMSCNGQSVMDCYVVFLMEDGTLEYSSIKNIITNLTTEGKVENVSNIQRIYNCSVGLKDEGGWKQSVIALDYENNLYDIGYILYK